MNGLDLSDASDIRLGSNTITAIYYGSTLLWPLKRDYSKEYLTIEAVSDATVVFYKESDEISRTIQYSKNKRIWETISFGHTSGDITELPNVSLLAGNFRFIVTLAVSGNLDVDLAQLGLDGFLRVPVAVVGRSVLLCCPLAPLPAEFLVHLHFHDLLDDIPEHFLHGVHDVGGAGKVLALNILLQGFP